VIAGSGAKTKNRDVAGREWVVIDPAAHTPETDSFNQISALAHSESGLKASYHLPGICGLATLRQVTRDIEAGQLEIAGIITLGSATSVHDNFPWQEELKAWLRPMIDRGTPYFGFCFGHQLLAHMYGAPVGFVRHDQEKIKGYHQVELKSSRLSSAGHRSLLRSHREMVTAVPAGFKLMATSPDVTIDGLEHGSLPVWSLQTHPEATPIFLVNQEIDAGIPADVTNPESHAAFRDGWELIRNFLRATV
jgi:GMP synthase-like glutamine amidotransferase